MNKAKRYAIKQGNILSTMVENPNGAYVLNSDHEQLQKENGEFRTALEKILRPGFNSEMTTLDVYSEAQKIAFFALNGGPSGEEKEG